MSSISGSKSRQPRPSILCLILGAVALASTGTARADLWYESYEKAETAIRAEKWNEAIQHITRALEQKGDSSARARTYGVNFIPYFPHLKMGVAYYHLGKYDAALKEFDLEERVAQINNSASDLQNLQAYRRLTQEATQDTGIAGIVKKSLEEARNFEQEGKLTEAIVAAGRALAADSKNAEALAAISRLQAASAEAERRREENDRAAALLKRGKTHFAAGEYEEASASLSQFLTLKPRNAEASALLDQSQQKLLAQIEASRSETTLSESMMKMVDDSLAEAIRLEKAGQVEQALKKVQSVLAILPGHAQAANLQGRLISAQAAAERRKSMAEGVARILEEGRSLLEAGDNEKALAVFYQALAIDPTNQAARERVMEALTLVNQTILARGGAPIAAKLVPIIDLNNATVGSATASSSEVPLEEQVSSPKVRFSGIVRDDQPKVTLTLFRVRSTDEGTAEEAVWTKDLTSNEKDGNFYRFLFEVTWPLESKVVDFKVSATDQDQLRGDAADYVVDSEGQVVSKSFVHRVRYVRPWWRFWPYGAAASLLLAGVFQGRRIHRRNQLLKRRFNPYIAGAPVLQDELFFGRQRLLDRVLQTVHNNSILLHGERRIGKTSFQHCLKRRLTALNDPHYTFYPVFIDLQGTPEERFFAHLGEEIFHELAPLLDGLKPHAAPAGGGAYDYRALVGDIRDVLKALQAKADKQVKLVLLIDEVDELNGYDPRVNQRLRSLFMRNFAENLVAVVSGVAIKKQWESAGSPWYNFFEEIEVKPFLQEDARELIERPIRGIFKLERGVAERIIALTDCRPYLIQKLCVAVVNRLHEERRRTVTVADVQAVGRPEEA